MKKALVVGAGFAGCMFAMMLREKGWHVTVIERAGFIGGGVRTFHHGGHPFTYGPRHFLSPFPEAYEFLNAIVPMRDLTKINYSYQVRDNAFYTYPIHEDDIAIMPEAEHIYKELESLTEAEAANFEEFWCNRVGTILYERYVKYYNMKAWQLDSNTQMDQGFEATVKRKPLEKGPRHEYRDWFNCYPLAADGYNRFFEVALEGCEVRLGTTITSFDIDGCAVALEDGEVLKGDILISTTSPDLLMDYQYGELKFVGREFYKFVLPIEEIFPKDVYFIYYPDEDEQQTRIVEYKKFTLHEAPNTLLVMEVPSLRNKLYPTMIKTEVAKAQKYLDALPDHVHSVGRMGIYRYVDIDDIIMQGLEFKKRI